MRPRLNEPISQAGSVHAQVTGGPDAERADVDGEHRRSSHMATFRRWLRQDPSHNRLLRSRELAITPTTNSGDDHPCINRYVAQRATVQGMVVPLAVSARGPGAPFCRWIFWSAKLGLRLQA